MLSQASHKVQELGGKSLLPWHERSLYKKMKRLAFSFHCRKPPRINGEKHDEMPLPAPPFSNQVHVLFPLVRYLVPAQLHDVPEPKWLHIKMNEETCGNEGAGLFA